MYKHFCALIPLLQSWGKEQGCFRPRVRCGEREVKDTGRSSLAGKQSTCNSRKSLRAPLVFARQESSAGCLDWCGDPGGERRGECAAAAGSWLPWLELGEAPSSCFFIHLAG